ncbi:hypothetical protein D9M72_525540 [compost metagenome]
MGVHTIEFTGVDERCEHREGLATALVAHEQRILPRQGHGFHRTFDHIGVHFDPAILQEGCQSAPVVERVGDGLAKRRFRRHLVAQFGEMDVQFSHDWSCLATPYYEPGIGIFAAQFRFDAIDLGNPGKDRQRLRGAGELDDIDELAPSMGKAEGQPHGRDITLPPALGHGFIGLIPINLKHAGK